MVQWHYMATLIRVNIGLANILLPDETNPLPELNQCRYVSEISDYVGLRPQDPNIFFIRHSKSRNMPVCFPHINYTGISFIRAYTYMYMYENDPINHKRIDGLVQERRNSSELAMELRISCTNPLIYHRSLSSTCQKERDINMKTVFW